jgi:hypothetical protein
MSTFGVTHFFCLPSIFILMYIEGTMDGALFGLQSDGFEEASRVAQPHLKLALPASIRSIR